MLVQPGSPGSRRLFRPDAELAVRELSLRLLSYDRPGCGRRSRREDQRIAKTITDLGAIARALGIQRLGI